MRHVAALLGLVVVGLPLVVTASWVVVVPGAIAALLIAAGIIALSLPLTSAGIAVSLIEFTLALWLRARPIDPLAAVALGTAVVLLLEVVDFSRRFQEAAVHGAVISSQIRYWVRVGIIGVILGLVISVLGTGLTPALPPAAYPGLAGAGALIAVIGIARLLVRRGAE